MINYFQITKIASNLGLPEETIEKDYFIELLLFYIARNKNLKGLIFRGGTALRKVYFPDYRFSGDIDFLTRADLKDFPKHLNQVARKLNQEFPAEAKIKRDFLKEGRLQIFMSYNIIPDISAVKELKIDILQDHYLLPCWKRGIKFSYQDFRSFEAKILVYDLESILADKISRIFDVVNEPRDIYDAWYLVKIKLDFKKVKNIFKEKHGFELDTKSLLSEIKKEEHRTNWRIRLSQQVPNLPDFDRIIKELSKLFNSRL